MKTRTSDEMGRAGENRRSPARRDYRMGIRTTVRICVRRGVKNESLKTFVATFSVNHCKIRCHATSISGTNGELILGMDFDGEFLGIHGKF